MHEKEIIVTIKKRRKLLKLNQQSLAQISGVSLRTIKAFESGQGNPTLRTISKLADVLGLVIKLEIKK